MFNFHADNIDMSYSIGKENKYQLYIEDNMILSILKYKFKQIKFSNMVKEYLEFLHLKNKLRQKIYLNNTLFLFYNLQNIQILINMFECKCELILLHNTDY